MVLRQVSKELGKIPWQQDGETETNGQTSGHRLSNQQPANKSQDPTFPNPSCPWADGLNNLSQGGRYQNLVRSH